MKKYIKPEISFKELTVQNLLELSYGGEGTGQEAQAKGFSLNLWPDEEWDEE